MSTIVIIFEERDSRIANLLTAMISLFIALEIIQLISYFKFDMMAYFKDIWNIIDWCLFIMTIIYPTTLQKEIYKSGDYNKIGGVIILLMTYYRGFSNFRIFEVFTSYVEIINSVISKCFCIGCNKKKQFSPF